jgi:hypothetical protein
VHNPGYNVSMADLANKGTEASMIAEFLLTVAMHVDRGPRPAAK